jgi:hypothetical protein
MRALIKALCQALSSQNSPTVAACVWCSAACADSFDDAKDARAFCATPSFKQLPCGFTSLAEEQATARSQCLYCGSVYIVAPSQLPATIATESPYRQMAVRAISLACSGRVVVRSVFKITEQPPLNVPGVLGTGCTNFRLHNGFNVFPGSDNPGAAPVIRCELQLPGGPGSEAERALRSKEVNCYRCELCSDGKGCPSKAGVWYSDSHIRTVPGCSFDANRGYMPPTAEIALGAGVKVLLAKFEVCNSASCFNQSYEDAKAKSAKSCIKGKCA